MQEKKQSLSIETKKEDNLSKWYTELITKAKLIDYTKVSGCIVYMPKCYEIWEKIRCFFDNEIKKISVKNCYFPSLIPKNLLQKEEKHIEGFSAEVAWITKGGNSKLSEELAIRPTSETIIYDSFSKWIRSYKDLPLKLNQWCNIVRWEFKHPTPLLRGREFLWQEGHCVFEKENQAEKNVFEILNIYKNLCEDLLAIPVECGLKSINEKFAGAVFSTTIESLMPDGKVLQSGTSHNLGQNFSKSFDIKFEKEGNFFNPYQTSWGISTRLIGAMILIHSDDRGFVCPPKVSENKVVIVPLLFKGKEKIVLEKAKKIFENLKKFNPILDEDETESAGFKFNKWEQQGIPLRIEIGPKDVENKKICIVRRDTQEKFFIEENKLDEKLIQKYLENIQKNLFQKAKNFLDENSVYEENYENFKKQIKNKKRVLVPWFEDEKSEKKIKEDLGAKTSCIPIKFNKKIFEKYELPKELKIFENKKIEDKICFCGCSKKANCFVYFAKSY